MTVETYNFADLDRHIEKNRKALDALKRMAFIGRFRKPWWSDPAVGEMERAIRSVPPHFSGTTGTWTEAAFVSTADFTAVASTNVEATLLSGVNEQPTIPALFFFNKQGKYRAIRIFAKGVFSNTGTPTLTFFVRMSTTQGSSTLSGAILGQTAAITSASAVTNVQWALELDLICTVGGQGTGNSTLAGAGWVTSPAGFASPFTYALESNTPPSATWTQTFDGALTQYINLSMTWSASSASNTITCKQLALLGLN